MRCALRHEPDVADADAVDVFPRRSDWGFSKSVTDDTQELFHAGAVSPKGFDDA
jgi:hypothetical protein